MVYGSGAEGSTHSDTIVRWNTAKELPNKETSNKQLPPTPRMKHDVRFNLPEMKFSHDEGSINWRSNADQEPTVDASHPSPDYMFAPRAESVATHVLDNNLARTDHVLRLRRQARQERRALKESGDYLGVQGINPETGRLDVETPTGSDESQPSNGAAQGDHILADRIQNMTEKEKKKLLLKTREDELRRMEESKREAEELANQLMWRRHTKEWSRVNNSGTKKIPRQQMEFSAEQHTTPGANNASQQVPGQLIDLESSQMQNASCESLDSNFQNERQSSGTVVHTPHQRSLADVSRAALELFENGISFDHSFRPKKAGHGAFLKRKSSEAISPTSKVDSGAKYLATSNSQPFLGKHLHNQEDPGGEPHNSGHGGATRKAFRELTNSLRTKKSITNIMMTNTHNRIHNMARKHMLKKENDLSTANIQIVGGWTEDVVQEAEGDNTTPPNLPTIQTLLEGDRGSFQTTGKGTEVLNTIVTPDKIRRQMSDLQGELRALDSTKTEHHHPNGHEIIEPKGPNITSAGIEAEDRPACTHTTITTGSLLVTSTPAADCKGLAESNQNTRMTSYKEKRSNISSRVEDTATFIQSGTTYPETTNRQQDAKPYVLKTTRAANRLQLRQKKVDNAAESAETTLSATNHNQIGSQSVAQGTQKVAYTEERKKKREATAAAVVVPVSKMLPMRNRCDACSECSECLQIPGSFPAHLIENGVIAPRSAKVQSTRAKQQLKAVFDHTLGSFVAVVELYCKIVRPVFDPYSALWERNVKKETTTLDMIVLVVALPGVIVAIAMAAWALRVASVVGGYVRDAAWAFGSNVWLLSGCKS